MGITKVGQLASMDPCQIRTLRGVRPNKVETVKSALKTFHAKLIKEGKMEEKKEKVKAPVEEVTSPEDEEKIKEDLFLRPSPSPIDLEFPDMENVPGSPERPSEDISQTDTPPKIPSPSKASSEEKVKPPPEHLERQYSVRIPRTSLANVLTEDVVGENIHASVPPGEDGGEDVVRGEDEDVGHAFMRGLEATLEDLCAVGDMEIEGMGEEMCWKVVKKLSTMQGKLLTIQDKVLDVMKRKSAK